MMFLVTVSWMACHGCPPPEIVKQLLILVLYTVQPFWLAIIFMQRGIMQARLHQAGLHGEEQKMLPAAHMDVVVFDKTGTLSSDQVRTLLMCYATL